MSGGDENLDGPTHWLEQLPAFGQFSEQEIWSLALVEGGLRAADLAPLANHLRNGFALPRPLAEAIAEAIEGRPDAVCRIAAKQSSAGRTEDPLKHTRHIEIAMAVYRRKKDMKRCEYEATILAVAEEFDVSRTTVESALRHFSRLLEQWQAAAR